MTGAKRPWTLIVLPLVLACGSSAPPKEANKATNKAAVTKAEVGAAKSAESKTAAGAKAEAGKAVAGKAVAGKAEPGAKPEAGAKPAGKVFDVTKDKSGILARSAAVLEASGELANEDLAALAHLSKDLPSAQVLCKHMAKVRKSEDGLKACLEHGQHHIVHLGPEVYAELAACTTAAQSVEALEVCTAAEVEAEAALHYKPHGDNLDAKVCGTFFKQFEKLAMEDAGDQAEIVKSILTEVKADVIEMCIDHGRKGEIECAAKAKTLSEVKDCAADLL